MDSDQLTELILALQMIKGVGPKTVLKFFDTVKPRLILENFRNMHRNSTINRRINEGSLDYQKWKKHACGCPGINGKDPQFTESKF